MKGWLLDIYEDEIDGVRLWFICEDGVRRCFRQPMPLSFFIYGERDALHRCCLALRSQLGVLALAKEIKRDVFKPEPLCVLRVDVDNPIRQRKIFQKIKKIFPALTYYNADLPIQVHHAARFETFPMAFCDVQTEPESDKIATLITLNSRWDLNPVLPVLRVLKIRPDRDPKKDSPQKIWLSFHEKHWRIDLRNPQEIIAHLNRIFQEVDPDVIQTQWGDDWLFPTLLEMEEKGGVPLRLNRDEERPISWKKETSYFSYGQIIFRNQEAHLFGRCHIDVINSMMWKDYQMDGALEMARVTAMPLEQAARVSPGSGISAMQMITALQKNILTPESKQQTEAVKTGLELIQNDRGGLIYQPKVGLFCNVAQIDFTSMYPAIIINGNISPEVPLPDGLTPRSEELGVVPLTIKPLYEKRVKIKEKALHIADKQTPMAKSYAARASALKWLLVVCFGFLGYKNARFGKIEAHEAVTRGGREALLIAKEAAEENSYRVLHMFVDALWIQRDGANSIEDFQPALDEISRRTGMIISLDGIYRWIAFLPSRNNDEQPVPNRYFGVFQDGSLKIRGIEARRHDMPLWVVDTQLEMLNVLAKAGCARQLSDYLPKAFAVFKRALDALEKNQVPLEKLTLNVRVSQNPREYKSPTAAARAMKQLMDQTGQSFSPGRKARFLYTTDVDRVAAWEIPGRISPDRIDKPKYRELLARAAGSVFYPFGIDPAQLCDYAQGALQYKLKARDDD